MNENLWHELRAQNIGGSEVADLFDEGYNSKYQLWHMKKGLIPLPDFSGNERIEAGTFMEPSALTWANHRWGTNFKNPKIYVKHPTVKGMACTPDGIDNDINALCQIKIVDSVVLGRDFVADGNDILEAPLKYTLQCQHEMACTGHAANHLIVLVGGNRLCRMVVERDEEIIAALEKAVTDFWSSIEANDVPAPNYTLDSDAIQKVRKQRPEQVPGQDFTGNNELYNAMVNYVSASADEKAAKDKKDAAKGEVMHLAGNIKNFVCGDLECTIVENAGVPDRVITPDMVGQPIKGRAGSAYPKIKPKKEK